MFSQFISQLATNQPLPTPTNSKQYQFFRVLRQVVPDAFTKVGNRTIFVGDSNKMALDEENIVEKMRAAGFGGFDTREPSLITPTKRQKRIAELEGLTDEELFNRIRDTFESLTMLSEAAADLKIRSMIVSGSPGTGKTFEVLKAMKAKSRDSRDFYFHQVKGTISPIALYIELYRARHGVLVLDDADEAFTDPESLQLLKAATESSKNRTISYRKLSMALEAEGIPQEFEFGGCVVVLTNTNLEEARKHRQSHYDAIMSRAHYINAVLETDREKIMRIRHIVTSTTMLHQFLDPAHHQEVIDFVEEHNTRFRELSIRTIVKLAELRAAFPKKWNTLARGTLLD
jgi:hypothetical protein